MDALIGFKVKSRHTLEGKRAKRFSAGLKFSEEMRLIIQTNEALESPPGDTSPLKFAKHWLWQHLEISGAVHSSLENIAELFQKEKT